MSENDENAGGDPVEISYGGIAKTVSKSIAKRIRKTPKLKIPRQTARFKIPRPKAVHSKAEGLFEVLEFQESVVHTSSHVEPIKEPHKPIKTPWTTRATSTLIRAAPGFIRHSTASTISFSLYEYTQEIFGQYSIGKDRPLHARFVSSLPLPLISCISFFCGSLAGAASGFFIASWDFIASNYSRGLVSFSEAITREFFPSLTGVVLIHSVQYGILFSSYEVIKTLLYQMRAQFIDIPVRDFSFSFTSGEEKKKEKVNTSDDTHGHWLTFPDQSTTWDFFCISLAGGCAGFIADVVGQQLKPLENISKIHYYTTNFHKTKRSLYYTFLRRLHYRFLITSIAKENGNTARDLLNPRVGFLSVVKMLWAGSRRVVFGHSKGHFVSVAIPYTMGFLAYEYGRIVVHEEKHRHH